MVLTLALCVLLIGLDQLFKYLVTVNLGPGAASSFIPGILELRYLENDGAAFGILNGRQGFLIVVTAVALVVVAYLLFRKAKRFSLEYFSFLLIFTGGVGNLIDRVMNGYVVDYLNVLFMRFAIFNFADVLVVIGFGLLVIAFTRAELLERKQKKLAGARPPEEASDGED